jgi:hypothetical protein
MVCGRQGWREADTMRGGDVDMEALNEIHAVPADGNS